MNIAESASLVLAAKERGWEEAALQEEADLVLINTCSVRATAEERVLGRLAQYEAAKKAHNEGRKKSADAKVPVLVIAGCMAERLKSTLKNDFTCVDYIMGTSSRAIFPLILEAAEKGSPVEIEEEKAEFVFSSSHLEEGAFRSFVPIMHGCNNFCSYCIVPYVRGREVSRRPLSIAEEINMLAERGVREITLLGQNVNSYMFPDESMDFPGLLKLVAETVKGTPVEWVRFLSSHPKDLSKDAIEVMANNKCFCRHIHLPVQHGSNGILEKMNRRYTRERYLDLVADLRSAMPDITISTDILVGFPGETEDDVKQTLDLMDEVKFLYSYMYHYNPREGTAACKLPDRIRDEVKKERLSRVIEKQSRHTEELLRSRLGRKERVLIEGISRKNADELITRTEHDEMAAVPGKSEWIGKFGVLDLQDISGNTFRSSEIIVA
jgi:tRNA-2-methylthio-N6-dimethylallyladenosine synthase